MREVLKEFGVHAHKIQFVEREIEGKRDLGGGGGTWSIQFSS